MPLFVGSPGSFSSLAHRHQPSSKLRDVRVVDGTVKRTPVYGLRTVCVLPLTTVTVGEVLRHVTN